MENLLEKVSALAKRRGFIFPGSEIYGGLANSWDYGPAGVELKNNVKKLWWKRYVQDREDIVGIDAALIMNTKVWEASGHLNEFVDPLVECKECHKRFREDHLDKKECPDCSGMLTAPKQFNMMFKTNLGPVESEESTVYFRPETAQAIFTNFKNILDTTRQTVPFGIAQVGKAFRNEITPGNWIFRTREFEQMEIEYFIQEKEWRKYFTKWKKDMAKWAGEIGIDTEKLHELDVPKKELAHYSKKTIDFEFDFPFGREELWGLAYRTDFDLKNHGEKSGENLKYRDEEHPEGYYPHVIEPSLGVDRTVLAIMLSAYHEDEDRVVMKFKPEAAPFKAAVFPLSKNQPELVKKAQRIFKTLSKQYSVAWDSRGNVGKRYYSQDEIGTPYCITVDFQTLEDNTVTIRDRDTKEQIRIGAGKLKAYLKKSLNQ